MRVAERQILLLSVPDTSSCACRYVKFDTFHPAVDRGLPVTRVISRVVLQQLLAEAAIEMAGEDVILNDQNVVDYQHEVCSVQTCLLPLLERTCICSVVAELCCQQSACCPHVADCRLHLHLR